MMNTTSPGIFSHGLFAIGPFLLVDGTEIFARILAPDALDYLACTALPFLKVAALFMPHTLVAFATAQCPLRTPAEPTLSIIFLLLKLAIGIAAITVIVAWSIVSPLIASGTKKPTTERARLSIDIRKGVDNIEAQGGTIASFKSLFPILAGLSLFCVYWYFTLDSRPAYFKWDLAGKVKEDFYSLLITVSYALLLTYITSSTLYAFLYAFKRSPATPNAKMQRVRITSNDGDSQ